MRVLIDAGICGFFVYSLHLLVMRGEQERG